MRKRDLIAPSGSGEDFSPAMFKVEIFPPISEGMTRNFKLWAGGVVVALVPFYLAAFEQHIVECLVWLCLSQLLAIGISASLCRFCTWRHRRMSYGIAAISAGVSGIVFALGYIFYTAGWQMFSDEYWAAQKGGGGIVAAASLPMFCTALAGLLPAILVTHRHQRKGAWCGRSGRMPRSRRHEPFVTNGEG